MNLPSRKSPRLKNYDYSTPGFYFITICSHQKQCLLGSISSTSSNDTVFMHLSLLGQIVDSEIRAVEHHYPNVKVNKYVVMPNHVHLILQIQQSVPYCGTDKSVPYSIPNIVGKLKAASTRVARKSNLLSSTAPLWQKSYHDHVIRSNMDYQQIWKYIDENPAKRKLDCFYSLEP
mgnify:FL=1